MQTPPDQLARARQPQLDLVTVADQPPQRPAQRDPRRNEPGGAQDVDRPGVDQHRAGSFEHEGEQAGRVRPAARGPPGIALELGDAGFQQPQPGAGAGELAQHPAGRPGPRPPGNGHARDARWRFDVLEVGRGDIGRFDAGDAVGERAVRRQVVVGPAAEVPDEHVAASLRPGAPSPHPAAEGPGCPLHRFAHEGP